MVNFLNLIRWKNLLIMALTVLALKYLVFHAFIIKDGFVHFPSLLSLPYTLLLVLSIALVGAGGYVINDILDIEADRINKPNQQIIGKTISVDKAYWYYYALTFLGIALGAYLAFEAGLVKLVFFHVLCAVLLWLYSQYFKSSVLIGNLMVALLSALVPLTYFCFETYTYYYNYGAVFLYTFGGYFKADPVKPLLWFSLILAFFAFIFSLIREIIKDLQDMEGDKNLNGNTLPLAIGEKNALWVVRFLLIGTLVLMFYTFYKKIYFPPYSSWVFQGYFYLALVFPCLLLLKFLFEKEVDYAKAGLLVKFIMLFGLLSTAISCWLIL